MVNGQLDEKRIRLVLEKYVSAKSQDGLGVLSQFKRLVGFQIMSRTAAVQSASPMPAEQMAITALLKQKYGAGLSVSFSVNPDLIAGFRVQVGSDVLDASVRGRLYQLKETF